MAQQLYLRCLSDVFIVFYVYQELVSIFINLSRSLTENYEQIADFQRQHMAENIFDIIYSSHGTTTLSKMLE
jgi:hypothetical protein